MMVTGRRDYGQISHDANRFSSASALHSSSPLRYNLRYEGSILCLFNYMSGFVSHNYHTQGFAVAIIVSRLISFKSQCYQLVTCWLFLHYTTQ